LSETRDPLKGLEGWAKHGIVSIPLALVAAMVKNGLRWGGEYKESKDFMHFELLAENVLSRSVPAWFRQRFVTKPRGECDKGGTKEAARVAQITGIGAHYAFPT